MKVCLVKGFEVITDAEYQVPGTRAIIPFAQEVWNQPFVN
jgi:hypothetical protein